MRRIATNPTTGVIGLVIQSRHGSGRLEGEALNARISDTRIALRLSRERYLRGE